MIVKVIIFRPFLAPFFHNFSLIFILFSASFFTLIFHWFLTVFWAENDPLSPGVSRGGASFLWPDSQTLLGSAPWVLLGCPLVAFCLPFGGLWRPFWLFWPSFCFHLPPFCHFLVAKTSKMSPSSHRGPNRLKNKPPKKKLLEKKSTRVYKIMEKRSQKSNISKND